MYDVCVRRFGKRGGFFGLSQQILCLGNGRCGRWDGGVFSALFCAMEDRNLVALSKCVVTQGRTHLFGGKGGPGGERMRDRNGTAPGGSRHLPPLEHGMRLWSNHLVRGRRRFDKGFQHGIEISTLAPCWGA